MARKGALPALRGLWHGHQLPPAQEGRLHGPPRPFSRSLRRFSSGFAFLDFASRAEAQAAFEALQHSHLYGRRLVIEPAEEKANDVAHVQLEAAKKQQSQAA